MILGSSHPLGFEVGVLFPATLFQVSVHRFDSELGRQGLHVCVQQNHSIHTWPISCSVFLWFEAAQAGPSVSPSAHRMMTLHIKLGVTLGGGVSVERKAAIVKFRKFRGFFYYYSRPTAFQEINKLLNIA